MKINLEKTEVVTMGVRREMEVKLDFGVQQKNLPLSNYIQSWEIAGGRRGKNYTF